MIKMDKIFLFYTFVLIVVSAGCVQSLEYSKGTTNESINTSHLIDNAGSCIDEMVSRGIGINRVGEILNETLSDYSGQVALESQGKQGNYKSIDSKISEVCAIKGTAFKAYDELIVFNESYSDATAQINLSEMNNEYNDVIKSFNEERFEDTLPLIDIAYSKLSEVQASQTTIKLFYAATTKNLKDFFMKNWKGLSIGTIAIFILLFIFWKNIRRYLLNRKLNNLSLRRKSIEGLIKRTQQAYFKTKSMSETEFRVKTNAFKDMIRSIDAKMPEIKGILAKVDAENLFNEQLKKSDKIKGVRYLKGNNLYS